MFGYGFLAVVLVLYLDAVGLDALTIGLVLTLTLVGDTVISLWLTTHADRIGRRRVLVAGALLMVAAGVAFALTDWVPLLILAATIGVLSPTGNEVGPFLAIEQAALSQTIPDARRTATFAWYNLVGYIATATGALGAGLLDFVEFGDLRQLGRLVETAIVHCPRFAVAGPTDLLDAVVELVGVAVGIVQVGVPVGAGHVAA